MAPVKSKAKGQVPETILKKRKRDDEWAAKKAAVVADTKKKSKSNRKDIFKRAEQYVKEYRDQVGTQRKGLQIDATPACGHKKAPTL